VSFHFAWSLGRCQLVGGLSNRSWYYVWKTFYFLEF